MSANFYANVPISLPTQGFTLDAKVGGFGIDIKQGLFIPLYDPVDLFEPPVPPVNSITPQR